jgi:hypothetical protein
VAGVVDAQAGHDRGKFEGRALDLRPTVATTSDRLAGCGQQIANFLDPELVAACSAMVLPDMPERGRVAGIVGAAVVVGDDATPQEQLLAATGRTP